MPLMDDCANLLTICKICDYYSIILTIQMLKNKAFKIIKPK